MGFLDDPGPTTFYLAASSARRSFLAPLSFFRSRANSGGLTHVGTLWRAMREILKEFLWSRRAFNLHVSTCVRVKIEIKTYHVP
jgi:hypothetical protein